MDETLNLFSLNGRRALITGSGRGIGLALARGLAGAGAAVVINDRDEQKAPAVAAGLRDEGFIADIAVFDVTESAQVAESVDEFEERVGAIDILVNNAGIQRRAPLENFSAADWSDLLRVNLDGAFHASQAVARHMLLRGRGKIINICSVQGELARPGIAPYAATKGAIRMLTKGMCAEWAESRHSGQRARAGLLRDRSQSRASRRSRVLRLALQAHAGRAMGPSRRVVRCGGVSGVVGVGLRERADTFRRRRIDQRGLKPSGERQATSQQDIGKETSKCVHSLRADPLRTSARRIDDRRHGLHIVCRRLDRLGQRRQISTRRRPRHVSRQSANQTR